MLLTNERKDAAWDTRTGKRNVRRNSMYKMEEVKKEEGEGEGKRQLKD